MSYLVLARKYRPQGLGAVTGQEHVTRTLTNSIKRGKIAHAYLFCGPRGVGKTSIARILAKALNCQAGGDGPTPQPCLSCPNCLEIAAGNSLAVREIDGASHNSVDNVRELIDSFRSLPAPGSRYKVYIIDEVHMLSTSAFNALLKSLEEPPPHTVFILATTEVHKIPETVISRCQRHDFRALGQSEIVGRLRTILAEEKISFEEEAIAIVARAADGSMRDAQSLLERVIAFCDGQITAKETATALGVVEGATLHVLGCAIVRRESASALAELDRIFSVGLDPTLFLREFVAYWRLLLVIKVAGPAGLGVFHLPESSREDLSRLVSELSLADVQDLCEVARRGGDQALRSAYPRIALEALIVRMATREPVMEIGALLSRLNASAGKTVAGASDARPRVSAAAVPEARRSEPQIVRPERAVSTPSPSGAAVSGGGRGGEPAVANNNAPLEWQSFVQYVQEKGMRIAAENLRRISVRRFERSGERTAILEGTGPEFCIRSFERAEDRAKLLENLARFSGTSGWDVRLRPSAQGEVGSSVAAPGSIAENEKRERDRMVAEYKETVVTNPSVKALQKAFPGSRIEDIKVKEGKV